MGRLLRMRIHSLVDLERADDPAAIRAFANDKRLDRAFSGRGGFINRILTRKLRSVLALEGVPFPSVAPRGDAERARAQTELQGRLDAAAAARTFDEESIAGIAKAVRGLNDAPILEHAVQQAVGRLFAPDYQANAESFAAAQLLDAAAHSMNPVASLVWRITGQLTKAQRLLGEKVHGDRAGVHATGIAVHNLVRGFALMRSLLTYPNTPDPAASDTVVALCLKAPASVLREATPDAPPGTDGIRPGTLVVLDLAKAQQGDNAPEIVFMAGSWAQCPAWTWVPALIRAVWEHALKLPAPQPGPVGGAFRLDTTRTAAAHRRTTYRRLLGAHLIIQLALGIAMLAAPLWFSHVLAIPAPSASFVRLWGLMLLLLTALYAPGWLDPIYTRWPNVVGIAGRCATALLYLILGSGFLWFALFDGGFAVALAWAYTQAIRAELMTRP
jgi:hypothetical protein